MHPDMIVLKELSDSKPYLIYSECGPKKNNQVSMLSRINLSRCSLI